MNLQELLKKHFGDDENKLNEFLEDMKTNKIYTSNEENIDTRYSKLKGDFDIKTREHEEATKLIEELKGNNKSIEELQNKITDYETNVIPALTKAKEEAEVESALKVALVNAKVTDPDYIAYKVKEKGEIKLDENGNIKGIDDTLKDIKNAYPNFFETEKKKEIDVKDLGKGEVKDSEPTNLVEALTQKYNNTKNEM